MEMYHNKLRTYIAERSSSGGSIPSRRRMLTPSEASQGSFDYIPDRLYIIPDCGSNEIPIQFANEADSVTRQYHFVFHVGEEFSVSFPDTVDFNSPFLPPRNSVCYVNIVEGVAFWSVWFSSADGYTLYDYEEPSTDGWTISFTANSGLPESGVLGADESGFLGAVADPKNLSAVYAVTNGTSVDLEELLNQGYTKIRWKIFQKATTGSGNNDAAVLCHTANLHSTRHVDAFGSVFNLATYAVHKMTNFSTSGNVISGEYDLASLAAVMKGNVYFSVLLNKYGNGSQRCSELMKLEIVR